MKILLVDNSSRYLSRLKRLIKPKKTINWQKLNQDIYKKYDLIILSGGHFMSVAGHEKNYASEIRLIKKTNKPIIGICFGSELIAAAYGARLVRLKRKEHGLLSINQNKGKYKVYENHRWAIKKLPKTLKALARSKDGVEIFRHKIRPIFGIQFHPEMLISKTDGKLLLKKVIQEMI